MFFTSGFSVLSLILIYFLFDILGKNVNWKNYISAPFIWLGMNPLFIFVMLMIVNTLFVIIIYIKTLKKQFILTFFL